MKRITLLLLLLLSLGTLTAGDWVKIMSKNHRTYYVNSDIAEENGHHLAWIKTTYDTPEEQRAQMEKYKQSKPIAEDNVLYVYNANWTQGALRTDILFDAKGNELASFSAPSDMFHNIMPETLEAVWRDGARTVRLGKMLPGETSYTTPETQKVINQLSQAIAQKVSAGEATEAPAKEASPTPTEAAGSQADSQKSQGPTDAYFPGGAQKMMDYFALNIHYSDLARMMKMKGGVVVAAHIDQDGKIAKANIVTSAFREFDEEALRLVKGMPQWIPARDEQGHNVPTLYLIPVFFEAK